VEFAVLLIIVGTVVVLYGAGVLRPGPGGGSHRSAVSELIASNKGVPVRSVHERNGDNEMRVEYDTTHVRPSNPLDEELRRFAAGGGQGPGAGHPG
jgi:hypothetical protein